MTVASEHRPPLDVPRLDAGLARRHLDYRLEVLESVGSTNAVAAERAADGAASGLVVVAEHQSAGRGRLGRTWEAPRRSGLTFSVLLRPEVEAARWPWLSLLVGLAVREGLPPIANLALKWPNDVLVADRKLAGLLLERCETPAGPAAVVGVGLNVSMTVAELPTADATSLDLEAHGRHDRTEVLVEILNALDRRYAAWVADPHGDAVVRAAYGHECATLGRQVEVNLPGGDVVVGCAIEVDPAGRLVVDGPDGIVRVAAGDVIHIRPRR